MPRFEEAFAAPIPMPDDPSNSEVAAKASEDAAAVIRDEQPEQTGQDTIIRGDSVLKEGATPLDPTQLANGDPDAPKADSAPLPAAPGSDDDPNPPAALKSPKKIPADTSDSK